MAYTSMTTDDRERMLTTIGVDSVDRLFDDVPADMRFSGRLQIPEGIGESELFSELAQLAERNVDTGRELSFLGAGCYDHYVPAVCEAITSRGEFQTAYTPYQPEISQGTLQAVFEFQTAICELTGTDVANASLYDGATAAAEAMYLAQQTTGRSRAVVCRTVAPHVRAVLHTYARAYGIELSEAPLDPLTGATDGPQLQRLLDSDCACLIAQQPNFFGVLEEAPELMRSANEQGIVPIVFADPLSLGVLEAPGAYGAGVVVGEGQALGNRQAFGGPSFGFMGTQQRFVRRMPGRIVGLTVDAAGTPCYALTLQTREQHIRRERATSNICTNQALNALSGIVYLAWLGPRGLTDLGELLLARTALLRQVVEGVPSASCAFDSPSFKETLLRLPVPAAEVVRACRERGVHPGFDVAAAYPELAQDGGGLLLAAVTERRSEDDVRRLGDVLTEVLA